MQKKSPESRSRGPAHQLDTGENFKKEMLKSSTALDRFHWILKMKRRVEEGRGWTEKKAAEQKKKRENRSDISSTLQRC